MQTRQGTRYTEFQHCAPQTEDNDLSQEIAQTLLSEHGIICDRAENGQECVDMLFGAPTGTPIALILMDIQMPIMNGKQATRVIRQHGNPIPIAAMTADAFAKFQAAFTPKRS